MAKAPKIDPEFRDFLPECGKADYDDLRRSIIDEGVRDRLIVWAETGILIDGHRRFSVCQEIKSLKYRYDAVQFGDDTPETRAKIKEWMALNQLGRRNLPPQLVSYFRGKQYLARKQSSPAANLPMRQSDALGEYKGNSHISDPEPTAAEQVAEAHGVSPRTIQRDADFAKAVDASPVKDEILAGKVSVAKAKKTLFCDRCTRIGVPVKNCPDCRMVQREAGHDVRGPRGKKYDIKPKAGEAFDWPAYEKEIGSLTRRLDQILVFYGKKNNEHEHKLALGHLEQFGEVMARFKKRLTASGG